MPYSLVFAEQQYQVLVNHLFWQHSNERAAYLICGVSRQGGGTRLLVREVHEVRDEDVLERSATHLVIPSRSYVRAIKRADSLKGAFVFVHSHPNGYGSFSGADDATDAALFRTAHIRAPGSGVHASLVFPDRERPFGRVWLPDGTCERLERITVIGTRFRFAVSNPEQPEKEVAEDEFAPFDRQVRAFGRDLQPLLKRLVVGVVGVGGTGSSVAAQLIRLGVGRLVISDGQTFDKTNVNRVYGSRVSDVGTAKVGLIERLATDIGLGTSIQRVSKPITFASAFRELLACDVVFGCTDGEWSRSILTRLPVWYYIPVIDMGVQIDSDGKFVRSIQGRVTVLLPGSGCLFCRERISPRRVRAESLSETNPTEAEALRKEGYLDALEEPAPAVIPFTTAIAASAVGELLQRITGFMGNDRETTELLHLFDSQRVRSNNRLGHSECFCMNPSRWGVGDRSRMLDISWRPE